MGKNQDAKWIINLKRLLQDQVFNQLGFLDHNESAKWAIKACRTFQLPKTPNEYEWVRIKMLNEL